MNDFNPTSYLYDVYDLNDETQKLQYTSYVPMFLDSISDNSNFVPGTDRRIVRGTLRITVKGWLTPVSNNKPYVHDTKVKLTTSEVIDNEGQMINLNASNASDTAPSDVNSFLGRTGPIQAETGDYNAGQITLTNTTLGSTVEAALYALANENNVLTTVILGEPMPANTCYKLISGKAFIVRSTDMTVPIIDGITLEAGSLSSTVTSGRQIGGNYAVVNTYTNSGPLYLSQNGQLTPTPPSFDTGDNFLMVVARSQAESNQIVFNPGMIVRLN